MASTGEVLVRKACAAVPGSACLLCTRIYHLCSTTMLTPEIRACQMEPGLVAQAQDKQSGDLDSIYCSPSGSQSKYGEIISLLCVLFSSKILLYLISGMNTLCLCL